jgi:hypothetical protein
MKTWRNSLPLTTVSLMFGLLLLLFTAGTSALTAEEGSIIFSGPRLKIYFQPRIRTISEPGKGLKEEVARLNLCTNVFENYLEYLIKLGKVASSTRLQLEYNPDQTSDAVITGQRFPISDLGFNAILETVNSILLQQRTLSRSILATNRDSLLNIKDVLQRKTDSYETNRGFTNISDRLPSLEPDVDFCRFPDGQLITIRPTENGNQLVLFGTNSSGTLFMPSQKEGVFGHLSPSPQNRFLACTVAAAPVVIRMTEKTVVPLYPDQSFALLDMAWSPTQERLAGIALNRQTKERRIFIYEPTSGKHLSDLVPQGTIEGNYQFSYPFWSPDGTKVLFSTGDEISLFDLATGKAHPGVLSTSGAISEILWAPDSNSFALVEINGQSRDKQEFTDIDFKSSVLRRMKVSSDSHIIEDLTQNYVSSHTIKLLSFWDQNRILFLEGKLKSQRYSNIVWDLKKILFARLTAASNAPTASAAANLGPIDLPLDYCYAIKNLDHKFSNLFDSGLSGMNWTFTDALTTTWFIGLKPPPGIPAITESFCLRPSPYPFPERNILFMGHAEEMPLRNSLNMLNSVMIRRFEFSRTQPALFFLSNAALPLNLWSCTFDQVSEMVVTSSRNSDSSSETSENATETTDSDDQEPPTPPSAQTDGGLFLPDGPTSKTPETSDTPYSSETPKNKSAKTSSSSSSESSGGLFLPDDQNSGTSDTPDSSNTPKKKPSKTSSSSSSESSGDLFLPSDAQP